MHVQRNINRAARFQRKRQRQGMRVHACEVGGRHDTHSWQTPYFPTRQVHTAVGTFQSTIPCHLRLGVDMPCIVWVRGRSGVHCNMHTCGLLHQVSFRRCIKLGVAYLQGVSDSFFSCFLSSSSQFWMVAWVQQKCHAAMLVPIVSTPK